MRQKNLRGLGSFCLTSTSRYTNTCTFEAVVLRGGRVCHESQESRRRLGCLMYPPLLFTTESYLSLTWLVCGDTSSHVSPLTFHHWVLLEFHMACMRWYVLTCIFPYFSPLSPTWVSHGLYAVIRSHMYPPLLFTTESYLSLTWLVCSDMSSHEYPLTFYHWVLLKLAWLVCNDVPLA